MIPIEIHVFPCLNDNYGFLVHDQESGFTAAVDTPEAETILAELSKKNWNLTHIFNTHSDRKSALAKIGHGSNQVNTLKYPNSFRTYAGQ